MKKICLFEGATYWFNKAIYQTKSEEYNKAISSIREGFEQIETTPFAQETDVRGHIEATMNHLRSENKDNAIDHLEKLQFFLKQQQEDCIETSVMGEYL